MSQDHTTLNVLAEMTRTRERLVLTVASLDSAAMCALIAAPMGLPPHLVRDGPVHAVNDDPLAVAILQAWARQPFREAHYAAFRDRLADAGAPEEARAEADKLWEWVTWLAREALSKRCQRQAWIKSYWASALGRAFLREKLPF